MKSMSRKTFRFLVLLSWVIGLACIAVLYAGLRDLPPELQSYWDRRAAEPLKALDFVPFAVLLVAFPLSVAASVGLYRFKSWARPLYLLCAVGFLPLPPFEPYFQTPFAASLGGIGTALYGFILALVYFSPLSQYFEPHGGGDRGAPGV